jgi:hypothetical protein
VRERGRDPGRRFWIARVLTNAVALLFIVSLDAYRIGRNLPQALFGDEWRYLYYARNLLHGFYSPHDRVFLWNGPGYPLLLMPFVKADWIDGARYANALWHGAAIAYAWLILRMRLTTRWALGGVTFFALYRPIHEHLPLLYTEVLCVFLVTAWIYHSLKARTSRAHMIAAGCYLGMLCLTKVVFGVALTVFLVVMLLAWLRNRSAMLKPYLLHGVLALALCLPYLAYTYELTGRPFYWSSASGSSFYWLTSPYPDEWGDWYHQGWVNQNPILRAHHKAIFDEATGLAKNPDLPDMEQLFNMCTPEAADMWVKYGLRNVREHPVKFVRNWCANLVRLFLDVPVSVRDTPFWNDYSRWHLPMLALTAVAVVTAHRRRIRPPVAWAALAVFGLLVFGACSLSSAVARFMIPLVPMWWLGTCCLLGWRRR